MTFVCFQEFSLEGSQSMTCHDGRWSSVLPVCKGNAVEQLPSDEIVLHFKQLVCLFVCLFTFCKQFVLYLSSKITS